MPSVDHQVWKPDRSARPSRGTSEPPAEAARPAWTVAIRRGVAGKCPVCGQSRLFEGYLAVTPQCGICGTALGAVPADDAPPWVTMFIALHVLVAMVVLLGRTTSLNSRSTAMIMLPLALLLCMALMRPVKGFVIALLLELDIRREDQEPS